MYLTRFSWPGWCVSAHGLADGELLHVPLLPAGCCYAGTGDSSADNYVLFKYFGNKLWVTLVVPGDYPDGRRCDGAQPSGGDKILLTPT